jgi:hypothetical protein
VPANASLTPFDIIDLVMTDIVELDGAPWECCPRSTLKQAPLADFEGETGLTIVSAFEQEFQIVGASWRPALAFSLQAQRRCDPFAAELMAALDEAGSNPKFFCPSTAATSSRSAAIRSLGGAAADRVVAVREITREIALLDGRDTSAMLDRYVGITDGERGGEFYPSANDHVNADGAAPVVLVCEHASNYLPTRYRGLGLPKQELSRHIAWDIGAAELTRHLATRLGAIAIFVQCGSSKNADARHPGG